MRFEYLVVDVKPGRHAADQIQDQLNGLGAEGWELIASFLRENQQPCFVLKKKID